MLLLGVGPSDLWECLAKTCLLRNLMVTNSRDDEPSRVNDRLPVEIDRILPILA